jgi:hypothetical protein
MKMIPRNVHGMLDYIMGLLLIASPWLFGFADQGAASLVPITLGAVALLYSLLTDYEAGVARVFSFRTHLVMDFLSGALLAASPWLFGFASVVYLPHLILGLLEMMAAITTSTSAVHTHTARHAHSH